MRVGLEPTQVSLPGEQFVKFALTWRHNQLGHLTNSHTFIIQINLDIATPTFI